MIATIIETIFSIYNYGARIIFFYNTISFYFYFNLIVLFIFIFINFITLYFFYTKKYFNKVFAQQIINFIKLGNFFFLIFDLFIIIFFKKMQTFIAKPVVIIDNSIFNFFKLSSSHFSEYGFINTFIFEFSISNVQLFFIFLCRLIFFYVTYTFKYLDTYNFIFKFSFFELKNYSQFYTLIFLFLINLLNLTLFIFFTSENIFIFFIAFEFSVIPIFFMIGFFGKRSQKFKAMNYIFFFTIASAIPMLIGIIFFYYQTNSFSFYAIKAFVNKNFTNIEYFITFIFFYIPFSAKIPMMPFHVWLPEAHVEASTEGSMLLAGIMLKLGIYGFLKINYFILYKAIVFMFPFIATQAIISSFISSFVIYKQIDIKKIIAYSSIIHMNVGVLAFFSSSAKAVVGAMLLVFSHGLASSGMFLCVGILQNFLKERNILQVTGLLHVNPYWSYIFGVLCISNAGFPSTFSFIAEFFIISGIFEYYPVLGLITYVPVALCAHRSFLLFTQLTLGNNFSYTNEYKIKIDSDNYKNKDVFITKNWDLFSAETIILIQMLFLTFYWGVNPNFFFESLLIEFNAFKLIFSLKIFFLNLV